MPDRYFQLNDDVGLNANGHPEPLHEIGLAVTTVSMQAGEVVELPDRVTIKPIAGTRTFKHDDPRVAAAMLDSGLVHEIDPPTNTQIAGARKTTQDAREQAGTIDTDTEA